MINCDVIKDLLPLYAEGIASEESAKLIEEHIQNCEGCKAELESLKSGAITREHVNIRLKEAAPIKKVKEKLKRRKIITLSTVVALTIALAILIISAISVPFSCEDSALYSKAEQQKAMQCVKKDFKSLKGCRLYSLSYAGDDAILTETEYQTRVNPDGLYDEYIVIASMFRAPLLLFKDEGWNPGQIYTWTWILGRKTGGNWIVISKGYC